MVGETFDTANRAFINSFVSPQMLDGQFDFPLRGAIVDSILRRAGSLHDLDNFPRDERHLLRSGRHVDVPREP